MALAVAEWRNGRNARRSCPPRSRCFGSVRLVKAAAAVAVAVAAEPLPHTLSLSLSHNGKRSDLAPSFSNDKGIPL